MMAISPKFTIQCQVLAHADKIYILGD